VGDDGQGWGQFFHYIINDSRLDYDDLGIGLRI
jgi:hypothetical protein